MQRNPCCGFHFWLSHPLGTFSQRDCRWFQNHSYHLLGSVCVNVSRLSDA